MSKDKKKKELNRDNRGAGVSKREWDKARKAEGRDPYAKFFADPEPARRQAAAQLSAKKKAEADAILAQTQQPQQPLGQSNQYQSPFVNKANPLSVGVDRVNSAQALSDQQKAQADAVIAQTQPKPTFFQKLGKYLGNNKQQILEAPANAAAAVFKAPGEAIDYSVKHPIQAADNAADWTLRVPARIAGNTVQSLAEPLTGQGQTATDINPISRFIFGKEPLTSYNSSAKNLGQMAENLGVDKNIAQNPIVGAGLAIGSVGLDYSGMGLLEKKFGAKALGELAKTKTAQEAVNVAAKNGVQVAPEIAEAIAKTSNPQEVQAVLKSAETIQKEKQAIKQIVEGKPKVEVATSQESPLIQEARKYKTEEEFIKAQGNAIYHGTNRHFDEFDLSRGNKKRLEEFGGGEGVYFSPKKDIAAKYTKSAQNSLLPKDRTIEVLRKKDSLLGDIVEKLVNDGEDAVPPSMWKEAIEKEKTNGIDYNIAYDIAEAVERSKSAQPYQGLPGFGGFDPAVNKASVLPSKLKKYLGIDITEIKNPREIETYIAKDAKIKDLGYFENIEKETKDDVITITAKEQLAEAVSKAKKEGYDGIKFQTDESIDNTPEVNVWNINKIKTKSQLSEIYKQAHQKTTIKEIVEGKANSSAHQTEQRSQLLNQPPKGQPLSRPQSSESSFPKSESSILPSQESPYINKNPDQAGLLDNNILTKTESNSTQQLRSLESLPSKQHTESVDNFPYTTSTTHLDKSVNKEDLINEGNQALAQAEGAITPVKKVEQIVGEWAGNSKATKTSAIEKALEYKDIPASKGKDIIKAVENGGSKDPEINSYVKRITSDTDALYKDAKKAGVDLGYIQNYITHIWKESPEEVMQKYARLGKNFGFSKERTLPTYEEGIKMGLTPKYDHPGQILGEYVQRLEQLKANVKMFNDLKDNNVIVSAAAAKRFPGQFKAINAPGFPNNTTMINGETAIVGNWYAPSEVANKINNLFSPEESKIWSIGAKISGGFQDVALSGGIPGTPINSWTFAQMTRDVLAGRVSSPLKALGRSLYPGSSKEFFEQNLGQIKKMQQHGIDVNTTLDLHTAIPDAEVKNSIGEKAAKLWHETVNAPTFKKFAPQLNIQLFNDVEKSLLKKGLSEKEASQKAAQVVKNFYGITDAGKTAMRSKDAGNQMTTFLFAPRYRESLVNFWWNNVKALKNPFAVENQMNARFMAGAALMYAGYDYLNVKNNGRHMYENPSGKEDKLLIKLDDGTTVGVPYLSSIATMPRLAYRDINNLAKGDIAAAGKDTAQTLSATWYKPAMDVINNEDYYGNKIYGDADSNKERFGKIGSYLGEQYLTHPYLKAAAGANDKPLYQTAAEAVEAPVRFYSEKSINNSIKYGNIDKAIEKFREYPTGSDERKKAIQEYMATLPDDKAREQAKFILQDKGFETKGISTSAEVIRMKPVYDEIQNLIKEGKQEKAEDKINELSKEDYTIYKRIKTNAEKEGKEDEPSEKEVYDQKYSELKGTPIEKYKEMQKLRNQQKPEDMATYTEFEKRFAKELYQLKQTLPAEEYNKIKAPLEGDKKLVAAFQQVKKDARMNNTERDLSNAGVRNGEKAKLVWDQIKDMSREEQRVYTKQLFDKKIISTEIIAQLRKIRGY